MASSSFLFHLSPHTVAVAVIASIYVEDEGLPEKTKRVLSRFLLRESRIGSKLAEPSFYELLLPLSKLELEDFNVTVSEKVVSTMNEIQESPDSLSEFLSNLSRHHKQQLSRDNNTPAIGPVHSSSPLGLFFRRVSLAFLRLPFSGLCSLYTALLKYLGTCSEFDLFVGTDVDLSADDPLLSSIGDAVGVSQNHFPCVSPFSEFQLSIHTPSSSSMDSIHPMFIEFLHLFPQNAKSHFIQFLIALSNKDTDQAQDSLYRYFDLFCASAPGHANAGPAPLSGIGSRASYALLTRAAAHAHLNEVAEAEGALQEAVKTAHQHNEHDCLAFALAWLLSISSSSSSPEAMQRLIEKAKELSLHRLESRSLSVRVGSLSLGAPSSSAAVSSFKRLFFPIWDDLRRAEKVNLAHNQLDMEPARHLAAASVWHSLGLTHLSILHNSMASVVLPSNSNISNNVGLSSSSLHNRLQAISHLSDVLAQQGHSEAALSCLLSCFASERAHPLWSSSVLRILLQQSAFGHRLTDVQFLNDRLKDVNPSSAIESLQRSAVISNIKSRPQHALQQLKQALERAQIDGNRALQVTLWLQIASVYEELHQISDALHASECAAIVSVSSPSHYLHRLQTAACQLSITKYTQMSSSSSSSSPSHLLKKASAVLLESGPAFIKANALQTYADSLFSSSSHKLEEILKACGAVYERLHDIQSLAKSNAKTALYHHKTGNRTERAAFSRKALQCEAEKTASMLAACSFSGSPKVEHWAWLAAGLPIPASFSEKHSAASNQQEQESSFDASRLQELGSDAFGSANNSHDHSQHHNHHQQEQEEEEGFEEQEHEQQEEEVDEYEQSMNMQSEADEEEYYDAHQSQVDISVCASDSSAMSLE